MTADKKIKEMGGSGLAQIAEMFGCGTRNIIKKHKEKPEQFEIIVLGCIKKKELENENTN